MATGKTLFERDTKKPLGFFPKLYETVINSLGNEYLERMENIKDEDPAELMKFVYGLDSFKRTLKIQESYPEKNHHESKIKREYGNKAYQDKKDIDALYLFTQAVIAAPCDPESGQGKDLALALANRSAVLFSLKQYYLALDDIKLALESGYPKELQFKLLERKLKILMFYKQMCDAQETCKALIKSLDHAKLDPNKKLKLQRETQQTLNYFNKMPSVYNDLKVEMRPKADIPNIGDRNSLYPALANCISFKYAPGRGRFAVATRDIEVGQFICVEKPIVSRILPEYMGSNCAHCFKSMKAPLPCPVSTQFMFCSYDCRKKALDTYHPYEARISDFFTASGMSIICYLGYRAITSKPLKFFLDNKDKFQEHNEQSGISKGKVTKYLSEDYGNLFNLVTHHNERKVGDVFHRAMFAVMFLRCLKKFGYFGPDRTDISPENDDLSEDELFMGTLINHFLEVLQFNAHEVAQFEMMTKNREEGASSNYIGAGVYPTLAMFNHSCDPSIVRFYVEDVVCVQAIKNIRKGEEVCENYGPIFFHSNREERQKQLKTQYWFECQCLACTEDWPLMHEMTEDYLNFRCQDCNEKVVFNTASNNPLLRCVCGTPIPMLQVLKKIGETDMISAKAKEAMEKGDLATAQDLYCNFLTTLDKYLLPPYQDYFKIQQSIWKCIWMRFGNRIVRSKMRKPAKIAATDDYDTVD